MQGHKPGLLNLDVVFNLDECLSANTTQQCELVDFELCDWAIRSRRYLSSKDVSRVGVMHMVDAQPY